MNSRFASVVALTGAALAGLLVSDLWCRLCADGVLDAMRKEGSSMIIPLFYAFREIGDTTGMVSAYCLAASLLRFTKRPSLVVVVVPMLCIIYQLVCPFYIGANIFAAIPLTELWRGYLFEARFLGASTLIALLAVAVSFTQVIRKVHVAPI
jgi:hypothetical protein